MKTLRSTQNIVLIMTLLAVGLLSSTTSPSPVSAQAEEDKVRDGKVKKEYFTDEDLKVAKVLGKWILVSSTDLKQSQDYSTPVALTGIKTVYGQGKYLGRIKMVEAKIENRSQKSTRAIQFRWSIVLHEEPNNVLLEGLMPLAQLSMEPFSGPQIVDIPPIYFNKLVKPLLKDGEISGTLRLIVGIQEVHYADGTSWQRTPQVAFRKASFSSPAFGVSPQRSGPPLFIGLSLWRGPTPEPTAPALCGEQPKAFTSAALFLPWQTPTDPACRENRGCGYNPTTNKNICISLTGATCNLDNCDAEGHCNCWQGEAACATCPDNDGDGATAASCGGTDCNDNDESIRPGAGEFCGDEIDNDCDGDVDCADSTCQNDCADNDEDGYSPVEGDCDDYDGSVHPGGELCNDNKDNNCNGQVNEGCDTPPPCDPPCQFPSVCFQGVCGYSPILIDIAGNGFALTDGDGGVLFDLNSDGQKEQLAWTVAGSDDAWLALDRNADDLIDIGRELFGNFTAQPNPPLGRERNGFLALAEFDKRAQGGNGDDMIDRKDSIFPKLRLWQDANHNGASEPGELHKLPALDVVRLHLDYKESKRTDPHGNQFRYRAKVRDAKGAKVNRWAWDVYLVSAP